jgi:hypothetical protein
MGRVRTHLRNNVYGLIAVFIALGGTSYAVSKLPKNSVGAKQIKANGVRTAEIQDGAVQSADVGNGSLTGGDVQDGSLTGGDVQDGSLGSGDVGDDGLTGGDISDGSVGSPEVEGLRGGDVVPGTFLGGNVTVQFEQAANPLADNESTSYGVHCPAGQTAIGGGFRGDVTDSEFTETASSRPVISTDNSGAPVDNGTFTGWRATVENPTGGTPPDGAILPEVWVICTSVP